MKIAYVPLDERPCNYDFPRMISHGTAVEIFMPPKAMFGLRKKAADVDALWHWLFEQIDHVDGMIVSIDMLMYGGHVPSRIHMNQPGDFERTFMNFRKIKQLAPNIRLYGFQLIMRSPKNSSGFEEPDYYEHFGKEIFQLGELVDKELHEGLEKHDIVKKNTLISTIPQKYLADYLNRRKINLDNNFRMIELVQENVFDFFIFPQDDTASLGYSHMDQLEIQTCIEKKNLTNVLMYPGADEIGCTLLARMSAQYANKMPKIFARFSSTAGPSIVPSYEDRPLFETLKSTIIAANAILVDTPGEADITLLVNSPGTAMTEAAFQNDILPDNGKNIPEFITYMTYLLDKGHKVVVADSAYANGGDLKLFYQMRDAGVLSKLSGYAGWNTNSNTLGTAIATGIMADLFPGNTKMINFLYLRLLEDLGYMSYVRQQVKKQYVNPLQINQANLGDDYTFILKKTVDGLNNFIKENFVEKKITLLSCEFPWHRMFEVAITIKVEDIK